MCGVFVCSIRYIGECLRASISVQPRHEKVVDENAAARCKHSRQSPCKQKERKLKTVIEEKEEEKVDPEFEAHYGSQKYRRFY